MSQGRMFVEPPIDMTKPGEYQKRDGYSGGFIAITVPELSNKTIFVCSKCFVTRLKLMYGIPDENIMNMIDKCNSSPEGIPESVLPRKLGLNMFIERFGRNDIDAESPIIIHCSRGRNRSPVAAVIFLITKGIEPQRAVDLVTNTFRLQRDKDFILNPFGHYTDVLQEAYSMKENIDPNSLTISKPVKRPKRDLTKCNPRTLNFGN